MARSALSNHWAARTEEEKEDFTNLFGDLIEQTYMSKIQGYSGEEILYLEEHVADDFAVVKVKIMTSPEETLIDYRLSEKDGKWLVNDFSISYMSTIEGYGSKLDRIIQRLGYEETVKQLKGLIKFLEKFEGA